MIRFWLSIFLVLTACIIAPDSFAQTPVRKVEGNFFPGAFYPGNYVKNPGIEDNNKVNITDSSSIATVVTSNAIGNKYSLQLAPTSSGQKVIFKTNTFARKLKNGSCEANFWYSGTGASWKAYVQINSVKVSQDYTLATVTDPTYQQMYFPCGDLTNATDVVLESTASSGTILADDVYAGGLTQTPPVAGATLWAKASWAGTALCAWRNTNTGAISNIPVDTDCPNPTIIGYGTAAGTKIPGFVASTLPAGDYQITILGNLEADGATSGNFAYYRITDGTETTLGALCGGYNQGTSTSAGTGSCSFSLHVASDLTNATIQLQSTAGGTGGTPSAYIYEADQGFEMAVYRMPNAATSQPSFTVAQTNSQGGAVWTATSGASTNIATSPGVWASFSDADFATNRTNSGSCQTDTSSEISCKYAYLPAGTYEATFSSYMGSFPTTSGNSASCSFGIYDGTNRRGISSTGQVAVISTSPLGTSSTLTGQFTYTTPQTNVVFKVQGASDEANAKCFLDFSNGTGRQAQFYLKPISIVAPMPLFTQSVIAGQNTTGVTTINNLVTKTTSYTPAAGDETILGNAFSGAITFTLPSAASFTGKKFTLKKSDSSSNAITISTTSAQTIDGLTTYYLPVQYDYITVQSDGTNWKVISKQINVNASIATTSTTSFASSGVFVTFTYSGALAFSDTASAFSAGTYTVPTDGTYKSCAAFYGGGSAILTSGMDLAIIMGSFTEYFRNGQGLAAGNNETVHGCFISQLTKGQTITTQGRCYFGSGTCATSAGLTYANTFTVERLGD